ncbi:hypothetical protein K469DRAFT_508232, partial [Zopfia rhizophila CBS 207.26]
TSARANLGPLTTTFTPPPHCSRAAIACPTCNKAWRGQSCYSSASNSKGAMDDTGCWPRATNYPHSAPLAGLGFYSPGLMCPSGYTSACATASQTALDAPTTTIGALGPIKGGFQYPLLAGEAAVGCCPTGYTCATYTEYGWQTCHAVASSTAIDALSCDGTTSRDITGFEVPFTTASTAISTVDLWAPLIQINWQKSDTASESEIEVLQLPTAASSLSSATSVAASVSAENGGLNIGAKAGIAVSSIILSLCFLSIGIYIYARKR